MSDSKQENKFSQRLFKTGLMEVPTDEFDGDYLPRKIVRRQWAVIAILVSVILIGSISISLYFVFRNDFKGSFEKYDIYIYLPLLTFTDRCKTVDC